MRIKDIYALLLVSVLTTSLFSAVDPIGGIPRLATNELDVNPRLTKLDYLTNSSKTESAKEALFQFPELDAVLGNLDKQNSTANYMVVEDNMDDVWAKEQQYAGNEKVQKAEGIFNALKESKLIEKLLGFELVELPVGIRKKIGNNTFTLAISQVIIHPTYMECTAYLKAELSNDRVLWFGTDNLKFTRDGGIVGDATLGLFADFPMTRGSRKIAVVLKKFLRDETNGNHLGTYVTVDCDGFVEMRVDADLLITREWLLPTDGEGVVKPGDSRVKAEIGVTIVDWDDMVVDINIPHFTLTKNTKTAFLVQGAVIDLSDTKNAAGFVNPPAPPPEPVYFNSGSGYVVMAQQAAVADGPVSDGGGGGSTGPPPPGPSPTLWRGVFFKNVEIVMPSAFKNSSTTTKVGAKDLYIESAGVTGKFYIEDAIPYDSGKMNAKWKFSLDGLYVDVFYNDIVKFTFDGRIGIPIAKETKPFQYYGGADLQEDIYNFGIVLMDDLEFPLLQTSKVILYPTTKIHVDVIENKFYPSASITAKIDINATHNDKVVDVASAKVEKLLVQTTKPYIGLADGGSVTLEFGALLNNSFLQINSASLQKVDDENIKLAFSFSADIMSPDDGGSGTGGKFAIKAKMNEDADSHKWEYDGITVDALQIDISIGDHVRINGSIEVFSGDPVYGSGFKGSLSGGIIKDGNGFKFTLAANWIWGKKIIDAEEMRYWSFDAFVSSTSIKVPLVPGVLFANGFGGGVRSRMELAEFNLSDMMGDLNNPSSGITYLPNKDVALGVKASIGLTNASGAFTGLATLELEFSNNFVLNQIYFYGKGQFVQESMFPGLEDRMDKVAMPTDAAKLKDKQESEEPEMDVIKAAVMLNLDFSNGFTLHGSFAASLSAAEGKISGQGMIDLYASNVTNKWHLYIGGYTDNSIVNYSGVTIPPLSATINCETFNIEAGVYLMTGNDIPGPPPVHPQAASFFGISQNSNNRDILETGGRSPAQGTGFAFGAYAFFNTTSKKGECRSCLIGCKKDKYVDFNGGGGMDISLLKYAKSTQCGLSGHSPHGLRGWRAGGRLWFYMQITGGRGSFLGQCIGIPSCKAGFLLDGDLPKPAYFRAIVKLELLGFQFEGKAKLGTECGTVY